MLNRPLSTREVKELLGIGSYAKLNAILAGEKILPKWRGSNGNMYLQSDLEKLLNPVEKEEEDAFNVF